ncbi:MAG: dTDP-4-dehydrorhamnose 3,5-epimerase [Rhizobiaceae bacterium]|jgi:dTDP-4-dehydrorhamnose 3,5-epimerase
MRFEATALEDAWVIAPEPITDERGFFARSFCIEEFAARGLETKFVQHSISFSHSRHTLRGVHFQRPPHAEVKVVSCLQGAIFDVIVDLRPGSPTYMRWAAFELTAQNRFQLYVPAGFAHGHQTLVDDTMVAYMISEFHAAGAASGIRYDDPVLGIDWPAPPSILSDNDRNWPALEPAGA